jgi:hypothetical protein
MESALRGFGNIPATPAADSELAHVTAAFQPDGAQVLVQLFQCGCAAHFQIEPELTVVGILDAQSPQAFDRPGSGFGEIQGFLPFGAFVEMVGNGTFTEFSAAKSTLAVGWGFAWHSYLFILFCFKIVVGLPLSEPAWLLNLTSGTGLPGAPSSKWLLVDGTASKFRMPSTAISFPIFQPGML